MDIIRNIINITSIVLLIYFFIVSAIYVVLIILSAMRLRKSADAAENGIRLPGRYVKPISVIVPAYNEQATIIENITSLLALNYPVFEIVVVNDGSKDETLRTITEHFHLRRTTMVPELLLPCNDILATYASFEIPNLIVVDKKNGGKADALNAGINLSKYPLVCGIDADCVIEKDALLRIVRPFLQNEDTIAAGGIVRIANGCTIKDGRLIKAELPKKPVVIFQILEYFRAFLSSRIGWDQVNGLLIISGAFGLFRKSSVIEAGGYKRTIGEDMELTLNLHDYFRSHRRKYRIDFVSDAVCWTQAPDTIKGLKTQRIRWHRGLIDSLTRHIHMLVNPSYGVIGLFSMPYFFFVEMSGPLIELTGYVILLLSVISGALSYFFIFVFIMAYLYGLLFSLSAILLEQYAYRRYSTREILRLMLFALLEQLSYRQLTVFYRVSAFFNYRKGSRSWGTIKRTGFGAGS